MYASVLIKRLAILIETYGDSEVIALGDVTKGEFFEVKYIVEDGNDERNPYILAIERPIEETND